MLLNIFTLCLYSDRFINESSALLRGFFATKFNEYTLLHQHNIDKLVYKYPLVQYKIIDGIPMVVGINEGANVLKEIYDKFDEITLGKTKYEILEKSIS